MVSLSTSLRVPRYYLLDVGPQLGSGTTTDPSRVPCEEVRRGILGGYSLMDTLCALGLPVVTAMLNMNGHVRALDGLQSAGPTRAAPLGVGTCTCAVTTAERDVV